MGGRIVIGPTARGRRIRPLTVAVVLVLVLLGWTSATSRPSTASRHRLPARRAALTLPARGGRPAPTGAGGGAATCPPPVPARHEPGGDGDRGTPSAAVRDSPWVRYRLPASRQAGRAVALTFDDGPDPRFTPRILAILARAHVPATFFMIGSQAAAHPDLVRQVSRAGQAIGGHTWHHVRLDRLTPAETAAEVDCTDRLLARLAGHPVRLVRPPGGAYGGGAVELLAARGMELVLWTVDSRDWTRPGARQIEATVARELRPGAIVLLHDGGGDRSQTVAALPGVLGLLNARGYRAVALPTPRGGCCSTPPQGQAGCLGQPGGPDAPLRSPPGSAGQCRQVAIRGGGPLPFDHLGQRSEPVVVDAAGLEVLDRAAG
jgi:peptidoglycan-N-acetylglucosamine deacetylase